MVAVNEDGNSTLVADGIGRGCEGEILAEDQISRTNPHRFQRQMDSRRTRRHGQSSLNPHPLDHFLFEGINIGA